MKTFQLQTYFTSTDVGAILGVTRQTITQYLSDSRPGRRYQHHQFPAPDHHDGRRPLWSTTRRDELEAWANGRPGTGYSLSILDPGQQEKGA